MLKMLDEFEGHPQIYRRMSVHCIMDNSKLNTEIAVACQAYLLFNFRPELLNLPHLTSYTNSAEQPYDESVDEEQNATDWWDGLKA